MSAPPTSAVNATLTSLFRRQAGQITATLARFLGPGRLDLAEAAVQDALVAAMSTWPYQGIPDNPAGWLMRAARNKALDHLRKESLIGAREAELAHFLEGDGGGHPVEAALAFDEELTDDRLKLLFICCHPELPREAQVALALKTLFGFGVKEIAAAFLAQETAVAQRLVRAKKRIAELALAYELPAPAELPARLDAVLDALYLVFSEGYHTHGGDQLVRKDICLEAIRAGAALVAHRGFDLPRAHALMALMCLHAARLDARADDAGDLILLKDQDRSRWDQALIGQGIRHLGAAAAGEVLSAFHLHAGIAACHTLSASYAATDWARIVTLYDDLMAVQPSPVVALNRAAAVAMADGPRAGLAALARVAKSPELADYHLRYAVEAELRVQVGEPAAARKLYQKALAASPNEPERRFIARKLAALAPS